jgi:hypothetical protein
MNKQLEKKQIDLSAKHPYIPPFCRSIEIEKLPLLAGSAKIDEDHSSEEDWEDEDLDGGEINW